MTAKTASKSSKPAAAKPTTKTAPAKKVEPAKSSPAAKPPIGTGSPKLDRTLDRAAAKEAKSPAPEAAKAPKSSKAPAAPGLAALGRKPEGAPRAAALPAEAKLVCLMKENPSRAGSTAFKVRELYRTCKTVGEWRERVAASDLDPGYLVNDIRRGLVKVG